MEQLHNHYQKSGLIPTEQPRSEGLSSSPCSHPLRDCPFCGGDARFEGDETEEVYVICDDCEARVERSSFDSAADAWNRRND